MSSFDKELTSNGPGADAGAEDLGTEGRSAVPFFTLAIIAFALPRTILSSQAFTASISPSKPLLTKTAINVSLLSVMPSF